MIFFQPDELVRRLQDLENSATQDALVREKIANLPTEVTDPTFIDKVNGTLCGYCWNHFRLIEYHFINLNFDQRKEKDKIRFFSQFSQIWKVC